VLPEFVQQRGGSAAVYRRTGNLDAVLCIGGTALNFEYEGCAHEQGVTVSTLVFAAENTCEFVCVVFGITTSKISR
jgi:hypothetical protein